MKLKSPLAILFSLLISISYLSSAHALPEIFSPEDFGPALCVGCCDDNGNQLPSDPDCGCETKDSCGVCGGDNSSCGCELFDCAGNPIPNPIPFCRLDVNKDKRIDRSDSQAVTDYINQNGYGIPVDENNKNFDVAGTDNYITSLDLLRFANYFSSPPDGVKVADVCGICEGNGKNKCGMCPSDRGFIQPTGPDGMCGCPNLPDYLGPYNEQCKICTNLDIDSCGRCPGDNNYNDPNCNACPSDPSGPVNDLGCGCGKPAPSGCDNVCGSTKVVDECGVCGGPGKNSCGICPGSNGYNEPCPTPTPGECTLYEIGIMYDVDYSHWAIDVYAQPDLYGEQIARYLNEKAEYENIPFKEIAGGNCVEEQGGWISKETYSITKNVTISDARKMDYSAENMLQGSSDVPSCIKEKIEKEYDRITSMPVYSRDGEPHAFHECVHTSTYYIKGCFNDVSFGIDNDRCIAHNIMNELIIDGSSEARDLCLAGRTDQLSTWSCDYPLYLQNKEIYNGERKLYIDSSCNPVIKTPEESAICGKVKLIFKDDKITETETTKKIPTRKNQGCFPPDTKIKLADGSLRRADEVFVGDLVWNPIANKAMEIRQVVVGPELIPLIEFGNEQISGRVTEDHPVLTGEGLKKAKDLKVGDEFLLADGQKQTISYVSPSPVRDGQTVVNFYFETDERDKNNFMISDGIITGNLFLQQLLSKEE